VPTLVTAHVLQQNLHRLQVIRLIVFSLQLLALGYAYGALRLALDYSLILGILLGLAILNGGLYLRLRGDASPNLREFFLHLLLDMLGLSVLLYFTGGANNPFISYLLVPVTIAAATLPWRHSAVLTVVALLGYTLLLYFYQPLPALMPAETADHAQHAADITAQAPSLHSLGMWFNFLVCAALISYFVVKMAAELRRHEARLSQYREDTLRNEQIVAVATQAAGTAHALGTPLSTMAVVLNELVQEHRNDSMLQRDLTLLQTQIQHCREALKSLVKKADFKQQTPQQLPLTQFLQQLLGNWQLLRPELPCQVNVQKGDSPTLALDPTLEQALINLLNNAADASPGGIVVHVKWDAQKWTLAIRDQGKGVPRELREQLGTQIASSKPQGLGVGLVLSQATLNRLGGSVSLFPQEPRGTLTVIELPMSTAR
jgi:two-component system sensor histidine kinase RegB